MYYEKEHSTINAIDNWWGDQSGPYHPSKNPDGKGDEISDYVEFDPWLSKHALFQTLYVTKYGNDTTGNGTMENPLFTIQKAVDESIDWDTIRVFEGVYEENVVVDKSVEIIGNGSGETVIQGFGAHIVGLSNSGHYDETGLTHNVVVKDDYAYLANGATGLIIINISDPANPILQGSYDTNYFSYDLAIEGNYAYVAEIENGLVVIDISNVSNPIEVGNISTRWAKGIEVTPEYAYIADAEDGLVIVDIRDPTDPYIVGQYPAADGAQSLAVREGYAYIADSHDGLLIVDIDDPEKPTFVARLDTNFAINIDISGDYAYIADLEHGLVIVDISNPENPKHVAELDMADRARDVSVNGEYVLVGVEEDGLVIVDIADPRNPRQIGYNDTAGFVWGVTMNGDFGYIADYGNGLVIFSMQFPPEAVLQITSNDALITNFGIRNGSNSGVLIDADSVEINHCEITQNTYGIRIINGSENVAIQNSDIFEHYGMGIDARDNKDETITAINNWWGDPSGSFHSTLNPEGKGNAVSENVDFEPWLDRPKDFKIHNVAPEGNDITGTGSEGSPYETIQKAIDMAQEWDTIQVAAGTYSESIIVNKRNVTINGESPDTTILDADGADTTCTITVDNVELNGFTIRNGNQNGILFMNSSGSEIINCVFPDNSYDLNLTNSMN